MIGNRTPIISSAAVPSTGAIGSAAVYNTNIQYLDTGIKLEVEPNVYSDGEVSIKISLEVSDLGTKYENTTTGTLAYATTTNNATTTLRLKDGETQVLAGLLRSSTSNTGGNKVPGLGDVPLVGRLFGIQSDNWQNRELVLAITPRVVRNSQASDAEIVEMWSGTETAVRYDSFQKGAAKQPVSTNSPSLPKATIAAIDADEPPMAPVPPAAGDVGALRPQLVVPTDAKVGEVISVAIELPALEKGINSMSFSLKYDREKMLPLKVTEGNLGERADSKTTFKSDIDPGASQVMGVVQLEGNGLATTGGTLAIAQFRVVFPGTAALTPASFSAASLENKPVQVVMPPPHQINLSRR
jgi:general secretion pathway protein D